MFHTFSKKYTFLYISAYYDAEQKKAKIRTIKFVNTKDSRQLFPDCKVHTAAPHRAMCISIMHIAVHIAAHEHTPYSTDMQYRLPKKRHSVFCIRAPRHPAAATFCGHNKKTPPAGNGRGRSHCILTPTAEGVLRQEA
ncbi:hypothetical protein [Oleidesulfovibrio alaskensis]